MSQSKLHPASQRVRAIPVAVCVGAGLGAGTAALLLLWAARQAWASIQAPGPAGLDDGILLVGCAVGATLAAWLGAGVILAAMATLPGAVGACAGAIADRLAPPAIRKAVAFLLGTTLTAALAPGTAVAATGSAGPAARASSAAALVGWQPTNDSARPAAGGLAPLPDPSFGAAVQPAQSAGTPRATMPALPALPDASFGAAVQPAQSTAVPHTARPGGAVSTPSRPLVGHSVGVAPDPSWLPERPREQHPHLPAPIDLLSRAASPRRSVDDHVVVRRGDTLWSIAARHLGASASNAEIAGEWPRWFAANRALIGDDANLLQPGQLLRPPSSTRGAS